MIRLVVFDFQGTLTDAEADAVPWRAAWIQDLAVLLGRPPEDVAELLREAESALAERPQDAGYTFAGHVVAPALADAFLAFRTAVDVVLAGLGAFKDPEDRVRLLDGLLARNHQSALRFVVRPEAMGVVEALADVEVAVLPQGAPEPARRGLEASGLPQLAARVYGPARKALVDPSFDLVPEAVTLPGLARPVLLRRAAYHAILERLRAGVGATWDEVLVVGDVLEMDLALPLALGTQVALLRGPRTGAWEVDWLKRQPGSAVLKGLEEVPWLL